MLSKLRLSAAAVTTFTALRGIVGEGLACMVLLLDTLTGLSGPELASEGFFDGTVGGFLSLPGDGVKYSLR